ncbi:MAG: tRNA dihydrouridine synthase [Thermoguttaceae bacterium]
MLFPPLKFGPLTIKFPAIQAALSGYSDAPMRRIARLFGAEFTLCEVLLDQFVVSVSRGRKAKLYLQVEEDDHPCGAQLMGCEADTFVPAAEKLIESGFDLIDLNFACPVKKVLGRLRGGYMMSDPKTALEIVEKVRKSLPDRIPLTIKLRKGYDDSPESEKKFFEILDGSIELGIAGVTVHGRTVKQRYTGESDWDFISRVKKHVVEKLDKRNEKDASGEKQTVAVLGSGDLFTAQTCIDRMNESGVDGIALARGIIGNPWLFREVFALMNNQPLPEPPTIDEQRKVLQEHYRLSEQLYGHKRSSTTMRGFGIRYSQLHPNSLEVREAFVRLPWDEVLEKYYE